MAALSPSGKGGHQDTPLGWRLPKGRDLGCLVSQVQHRAWHPTPPKPGFLISSWPLRAEQNPPSFLCESCLPTASFHHRAPGTLGCLPFPEHSKLVPHSRSSHVLCPLPGLRAGSFSSFRSIPLHYPSEGCPHAITTLSRVDLHCFSVSLPQGW